MRNSFLFVHKVYNTIIYNTVKLQCFNWTWWTWTIYISCNFRPNFEIRALSQLELRKPLYACKIDKNRCSGCWEKLSEQFLISSKGQTKEALHYSAALSTKCIYMHIPITPTNIIHNIKITLDTPTNCYTCRLVPVRLHITKLSILSAMVFAHWSKSLWKYQHFISFLVSV